MDNLIFLDIDGVIITGSSVKIGDSLSYMDQGSISALRKVLACSAKPKIVISSNHRVGMSTLCQIFADNNASDIWGFVISTTGAFMDHRAMEIRDWLDKFDYLDYVVLDDLDMTGHFGQRMFVTDFNIGLTDKIADDMIGYLYLSGRSIYNCL